MSNSTLRHFLSGIVSTGIGTSSVVVLGLVGLVLTARIIPSEELGAFFIFQMIVEFLSEGTGLGINVALQKFIPAADNEDSKRRIINTSIYFRVATMALGALLLLLSWHPVSDLFGLKDYNEYAAFILTWFILESVGKLLLSYFQGSFVFRKIGFVNIISSIVNLACILAFVVWLREGLLGLLYAKLMSRSLAFGYAFVAARLPIRLEFDTGLLKKMLRYGFPLYINFYLSFAFSRMDTILIGLFMGASNVAFYQIAGRIPDSLEQFYEAFRQVYFPFVARHFARGEKQQVTSLINNSTRLLTFAASFGCMVAFGFGQEIIVLIFSDTYLPSVVPFIILMIGLVFVILDSTLGYALSAIGDSEKPPIINTLRALVQFACYALFIPAFGIAGAALAGVVALAFVNPINVYFLRRRGLNVGMAGYLKPLLLFMGFVVILQPMMPLADYEKAIGVLLFVPASVIFSVVRVREIMAAWTEVKSIMSRQFS